MAATLAALAQTTRVTDARGVPLVLPAHPRRIVSLSPAITETLFAIGAGPRVVGVTEYCDYPPQVKRLPRIGDFMTSVERVIERHPDLIVADVEANGRAIQALEKVPDLRGKVLAVRQNSFAALYQSIELVGRATGCSERARRVVADLKATLRKVQAERPKGVRPPRVVFVVQVQPVWVAGSDTFIGEMIEAAGGVNIGARAGRGYRTVSIESLVSWRPEVILSTHADLKTLKNRPGWKLMPAIREGRVVQVGYEAVRPSPRLGRAVETLFRQLYPR